MFELTRDAKVLDRRGFLKGSALVAAAIGLAAAVPAVAQEQATPAAEQGKAGQAPKDEQPTKDEQPKKKGLVDKNGREYRVCDMCGGNMYKEEKTWTCEQCGLTYEE